MKVDLEDDEDEGVSAEELTELRLQEIEESKKAIERILSLGIKPGRNSNTQSPGVQVKLNMN